MKEAYLPKQVTLLSEIRNWKNTENICKGVYDDDALKSRSFRKMKMQTYRQLYRKYNGSSLSLDEKALHRMLSYHFKKIERELYPNLLVRLGRRAFASLSAKVEALIKGDINQGLPNEMKAGSGIASERPAIEIAASVGKGKEQAVEQSRQPEGWWVNDLGRKAKKSDQKQELGLH